MGLFDSTLFSWLRPRFDDLGSVPPPPPLARRMVGRGSSSRAIAGGRLSVDRANEVASQFLSIESPPSAELDWRTLNLDSKTLSRMTPARLIELMADLSPEIANGIYVYLRLHNPGWEAIALKVGSDEGDTKGQAALDAFLQSCTGIYDETTSVPFDVIINILHLGVFLRGGLLAELVLDENGRKPLNIATPDPNSIRFKKKKHKVLGNVWELGQYQGGEWVALARETVRYVPNDPLPGKPYGRAVVTSALYTSLFLLAMLHDLKRVVQQQGYPRLDLSINFEMLAQNAPPEAQPGTEEFDSWVAAVITEINTVYSQLEPDDAYVHSDTITVNRPVGAIGSDALGAVDDLIGKLERMAARGMKLMPLLAGIDEATSDANANRQWEIQAAGVKSTQHLTETLLEHLLTLALQVQGIRARVSFRFSELRAAEMLRDAQTEAMQIANALNKYLNGWISQDEAAMEVVGHKADQPTPRLVNVPGSAEIGGDIVQDNGDGNEQLLREIEAGRIAVETMIARMAGERPLAVNGAGNDHQ